MIHPKPHIKDTDTPGYPSVECASHLKYNLCSNKDAPNPGHSRCIGSRACENWLHRNS